MKKTLCKLLAALLLLTCLSVPALADSSFNLMMIDADGGAIMYDTYDLDAAIPFAYIPEGSIAIRIATIDWGYCIAFGNYVGYIYRADAYPVDSDDYEFMLPEGEDFSLLEEEEDYDEWPEQTELPEFPYEPMYENAANTSIGTRSGPRGHYTEHGTFGMNREYGILYQTLSGGVQWCCIEFEYSNMMYRVYTSMRRFNVDGYIPDDPENYEMVHIGEGQTPRLGPGYEYASSGFYVPGYAEVKGYYQQDGWMMFDYVLDNGDTLRGWAEPGTWY